MSNKLRVIDQLLSIHSLKSNHSLVLGLKLDEFLVTWGKRWSEVNEPFDKSVVKNEIVNRAQTTTITVSESIDAQQEIEYKKWNELIASHSV